MARTNITRKGLNRTTTHEGGRAIKHNAKLQLERSTLACMLWEDTFYEDGESIVDRINTLCNENTVADVVDIALRAKQDMHLRHAPLWLVKNLLPRAEQAHRSGIDLSSTINTLITRPDDMTELLSMYWKDGKRPLSAQLKKGLALAFPKFDAYQLAKYNRQEAVKLRDVLFLSHAKPKGKEQEELFKALVNGTLPVPDTWEVAISAAKGNPEQTLAEWTRLLEEGKLGCLALLRNLRNMRQAGIPISYLKKVIRKRRDWPKISPFQFVQAFDAAPELMDELEAAMLKSCEGMPKLPGSTLLLIDTSGSMDAPLSKKGTNSRVNTAAALGIVIREVCEDPAIVMFGTESLRLPPYRGFALRDFLLNTPTRMNVGYGTETGKALRKHKSVEYDRVIVVTDEQSWDELPPAKDNSYIINVGADKPSIAYGHWTSLTGWSNNILNYIAKKELPNG